MMMEKFLVEGANSLKGSIEPSGNKNEALPVLAAVLLANDIVRLTNVPDILDIRSMCGILEELGVGVERTSSSSYVFDPTTLQHHSLDSKKAASIRGSFLLAGPLLAKKGRVELPYPGGDRIGLRPVHVHLQAFQQLGVKVDESKHGKFSMNVDRLKGCHFQLEEASVMATENAVMAAVTAEGKTTIYNAACEPHVQGLCHFLNRMGAKIEGIGSNMLQIEGVSALSGGEYRIQPDHTEVGSFIGLAAVTKSELKILNAGVQHLSVIRNMFEKIGIRTEADGDHLIVPKEQQRKVQTDIPGGIPKIDDSPWPGFPADLTSIITVTATQSEGAVLIFEKMFESRLFWVDKLISMGAQIILCDPHRVVVSGPSPLRGALVSSPDIRAGMALLIAAMGAQGTTEIMNIQQIDRGYESIDQRLNALGGNIKRVQV
ncbi:MAG: UDP-N-acetylglucosamine 1-carboxyvinyltransferase [SAR324 cluster bacterium]|nr:UDP-N-acetylglucosamine 1-carboxyvinyltransferase [Deltaproteobacteria bacterium]MDP6093493.1 UDP-N-acetylglucosamine 1-carboxyvinyltransferase [SAR324 cluster bacterium]MBI13720.1 UDP-N-acetylglucosamine 1-carboxyvinyltransferase [Deltaproteobacteria bacterium]MDP6248763.1 UDP-N-acetylglucosamine 1-carboxyvinyltransferase [SAR324 cluster bacterium]MDP6330188.1 UDP-N-acetylglucosamine 1-carboxyvinyltransferase [SAR324 cluster bacterium]